MSIDALVELARLMRESKREVIRLAAARELVRVAGVLPRNGGEPDSESGLAVDSAIDITEQVRALSSEALAAIARGDSTDADTITAAASGEREPPAP